VSCPPAGRFVFYELEGRGLVRKSSRGESRRGKTGDPGEQEVICALMWLRDKGIVPWSWVVGETRTLHRYADEDHSEINVAVNIDPWHGRPPLILTESRSLGGVLSRIALDYECDIAATNGQVGGFLHTEVAPDPARQWPPRAVPGRLGPPGPPDRSEHPPCSAGHDRPAVRVDQDRDNPGAGRRA
jgi:hypothetical protein